MTDTTELIRWLRLQASPSAWKAADTLEQQAAEIARWKAEYEAACVLVGKIHEAAVGEVTGPRLGVVEDVQALRAYAERYRLLRRGQHWSVIDGIGDTLRADDLDAAIDAALRQEQQAPCLTPATDKPACCSPIAGSETQPGSPS